MTIKTLVPTQDQVNELRNLFIQRYEKDPPAEPFHPVDIDRVRNDDVWCTRFLEMYDLDMKASFDKLWTTCIWRKKYNANDLNETNLRIDYLKDGSVFSHNKDVDGKPLLIFKTKMHVKGSKDMDEVIKVVVYWIERIQRETHMEKITVIFDMAGTGLSNMDLEFVKRIIETFKLYYPNVLNYILVYELAWVLNAAFKIIKGFLPEKALEILKMITKKDINTYIDKDNCLPSWGGNGNYEFTFVPEKIQKKVNGAVPVAAEDQPTSQDKKVHFANSSPTRVPPMTDFEKQHTPLDHDMLRISPNDFITFIRGDGKDRNVEITSTSKYPVTYKIQTTSPEKFRVRPRCGILNKGETVSVSILLKPEHRLSEGAKDKFLVMCAPVPQEVEMTPLQMIEVWKQKPTNSPDVEQHRLCCVYKGSSGETFRNAGSTGEMSEGKITGNLTEVSSHALQLEKQLRFTQMLQALTLVFILFLAGAVIYLLKLQMNNDVHATSAESVGSADDYTCTKGATI